MILHTKIAERVLQLVYKFDEFRVHFAIVVSAWLECSFWWALATLVARKADGNVGLCSVKAYLSLLVAVLHRPNYVTLRLCCAVGQRAQTLGKTA